MDSVSEERLKGVMPLLADKIRAMSDQLTREGVWVRVTQALRTWQEQDVLYAQGRTELGHIVTNVPGGHSYHNFGLAVDCVPSISTALYSPDWNSKHPAWQRMSEIGQGLGLDSGATWRTFPDFPHFQLTGRFPEGQPPDEVRALFASGGVQAVWDEVMKSYPVAVGGG